MMEEPEVFDAHHNFFSPNGKLLAMVYDNELSVRKCKTMTAVQVVHCPDPIKAVKWSPDSKMVLCSMPRRNMAEVFTVESGEKVATLECCLTNGGRFLWGPSSNMLVMTEPYLMRVLAWPLDDPTGNMTCKVINGLQPWASPCVEFSPDGQWLAVVQSGPAGAAEAAAAAGLDAETPDALKGGEGDTVALFSTITWRMAKRIKCSGLTRIVGISWSPHSKVLVVWSDEPAERVLLADVSSGEVVVTWKPDSTDYFVGLIEVSWSPSAQFVAFMTYNDKIYILSAPSWETIEVLACEEEIINRDCDIFQEIWEEELSPPQALCVKVQERPVSIARLREDMLCPTDKTPAGNGGTVKRRCIWSSGGRFLAVNAVLAPAAVWTWNVPDGFVLSSVIVLSDYLTVLPLVLTDVSWDPVFNTLAMCCGQPGVVLWNKVQGASCECLTSNTSSDQQPFALRLSWSPSAKMLIVAAERTSHVLHIRSINNKNGRD